MKPFILIVSAFVFALCLAHPTQAGEPLPDTAQVAPPELVSCPSATTCDRNPKHLESYVAQFYKWYVRDTDLWSGIPRRGPDYNKDVLKKIENERNRILNKHLTPRFLRWSTKITGFEDYTNFDFCPPGTDQILCAQAWNIDQGDNVETRAIFSDTRLAKVSVSFPSFEKFETAYTVIVRLKLSDNAWKIDGVTRSTWD